MKEPVKIVVYYDYICPWCYVATVRLRRLKAEYGDKIDISWRSFPLAPVENPVEERSITPHSVESRERAGLEEEGIFFNPWDFSRPYPASSLPALKAAKCAQLQGEEAFLRFHVALFRAFFGDSRDISDWEVLIELARETGLDVEKFTADFDRLDVGEILAEYEAAFAEYAGWGVPLALIGGRYPLAGAVPVAMYHRAIDLCLASQAGG